MRNYITLIIIVSGLYGCSQHDEPLNCASLAVQTAVLNSNNASGPVYYSRKLSGIKPGQKTTDALGCKADLSFQSNLDNKRTLTIPVNYTVYKVDNKSQSSTSALNFNADNKVKLDAWLVAINSLTKQLGDYQLASGGALYVMKNNDQQTLYFNGQPVQPNITNQTISIEKSYTLGTNSVFLVGNYTGGTIDGDTLNNFIVQVNKDGSYKITQKFAYTQINQMNESLVINGVVPFRPYAESTDFPVYVFSNGMFSTQREAKPDSYYEAKFATMTALDIVNIAKADQCFNAEANEVDGSHACLYATKYCFMFKAMKNLAVISILKKAAFARPLFINVYLYPHNPVQYNQYIADVGGRFLNLHLQVLLPTVLSSLLHVREQR